MLALQFATATANLASQNAFLFLARVARMPGSSQWRLGHLGSYHDVRGKELEGTSEASESLAASVPRGSTDALPTHGTGPET